MLVLKCTSASDIFFYLFVSRELLSITICRKNVTKPSQSRERNEKCFSASYVSVRDITWMPRGTANTELWVGSRRAMLAVIIKMFHITTGPNCAHKRELERAVTTSYGAMKSMLFFPRKTREEGRNNGLGRCAWWPQCAQSKGLSVNESKKPLHCNWIKDGLKFAVNLVAIPVTPWIVDTNSRFQAKPLQ